MEATFYFCSALAATVGLLYAIHQFSLSVHAERTKEAERKAKYWQIKFARATSELERVIGQNIGQDWNSVHLDEHHQAMLQFLFYTNNSNVSGWNCSCGTWNPPDQEICTGCSKTYGGYYAEIIDKGNAQLERLVPLQHKEMPEWPPGAPNKVALALLEDEDPIKAIKKELGK